jgi:hypothetical protein
MGVYEIPFTEESMVGDYILINPGGDNDEGNQVSCFDSWQMVSPLKYNHNPGEAMVIITERLFMPLVVE